jgi:hypothetical protein
VLTQLGRQRNASWARRDWIAELRQDLKFAWRQCRAKPGFALAAILTLGLGIGATTAIFSVVQAVVLKPYAYADPDRVLLAFSTWRGNRGSWSVGNFDYFRQRVTSAADFAADVGASMNLADNGDPERIFGGRVTWNYHRLFGISPAYGRTFRQDGDQPGRNKVVILSDRLWRRRFGADPAIVGRSIRINNEPHDVIGIMPAEMDQIGDAAEAWVPVAFTPEQLAMYDEFYLTAYVRQRKDVTQQQVRDEFVRIAQNLAIDHPELNRERSADVELMSAYFVGDYRTRLLVLLAAVALVLLIACGNGRQPAVGAPRGSTPRAGDPRRHRRGPRPHRQAGIDGESGARCARRHRRSGDRMVVAAGTDPSRAGGRAPAWRPRRSIRRSWRRHWRWCSAAPSLSGCCPRGRRRGARRSPRISAMAKARSAAR